MKRSGRWKEQVTTALEIPRDLAYQDAVVTVTGPNAVAVENYRRILRYTREEILLSARRGKIRICGKRLEIPCYTPQEMQITGWILSVHFLQ